MYVKRKKNFYESKQVETSLYFVLLDEVEVFQPCSPPIHEVEEATSLSHE